VCKYSDLVYELEKGAKIKFQTRFVLRVGFIREGLLLNVQCWSDNV